MDDDQHYIEKGVGRHFDFLRDFFFDNDDIIALDTKVHDMLQREFQ